MFKVVDSLPAHSVEPDDMIQYGKEIVQVDRIEDHGTMITIVGITFDKWDEPDSIILNLSESDYVDLLGYGD